jgi:hypothetical protein
VLTRDVIDRVRRAGLSMLQSSGCWVIGSVGSRMHNAPEPHNNT